MVHDTNTLKSSICSDYSNFDYFLGKNFQYEIAICCIFHLL